MAKYGFWNSKKFTNGVGDRLYNAEDLSFFYSLFFHSGLACTMDEIDHENMFLVTLTKGSYTVRINQGTAIIDGKWYNGVGDSAAFVTMNTSHTVSNGLSRIDAVCIKKDDENRKFTFYIKEGEEAANPVPPAIDKNVELCLAYYTVSSSYSVNYDSLVDTRKDNNFAGCAALKMRERTTIADEHINKIYYFCNGVDDNVKLSRLIQEYYVLEKEKDLEIAVVGDFKVSQFAGGQGIATDPLQVICSGKYNNTETNENSLNNTNNVILNFKYCSPLRATVTELKNTAAGYAVVFFAGDENNIKNAKVVLDVASSSNKIFRGQNNKVEDCYLKVRATTGEAIAADATGKFKDCEILAISTDGLAYGLVPLSNDSAVLEVEGCKILAQNASTASAEANGLYIRANDTEAILIASRNVIFGASNSSNKITKTYKINSGSFIITENIIHAEGAVYNNVAGVNANNLIKYNLTGFNINKYDL